jgi:hypothetical protein
LKIVFKKSPKFFYKYIYKLIKTNKYLEICLTRLNSKYYFIKTIKFALNLNINLKSIMLKKKTVLYGDANLHRKPEYYDYENSELE